jgi:hypothetical protein
MKWPKKLDAQVYKQPPSLIAAAWKGPHDTWRTLRTLACSKW